MHPAPPQLILLAPMEGVLDHSLRDVLTRVGGIDRCVSEFIRVTDQLLPPRVFLRLMPELRCGGRTPAGTPVRGQLLGSDPQCLADNAAVLASLGPAGIDLNFGCPAKIVNRHRGGAVLLDEPELLHRIVAAVRRAVPPAVPVSAKMRLGNHDASRTLECAQAIASAGADELVVHARTRLQGYRPPAHWGRIAAVRSAVAIRVVANGEVWTVDDARRCLAESSCDALMLGRGLLADPGLALVLRGGRSPSWAELLPRVLLYGRLIAPRVAARHRGGRIKQWLNMLRRRHPGAQEAYDAVRTLHAAADIERCLGALLDAGGAAVPHPHSPQAELSCVQAA